MRAALYAVLAVSLRALLRPEGRERLALVLALLEQQLLNCLAVRDSGADGEVVPGREPVAGTGQGTALQGFPDLVCVRRPLDGRDVAALGAVDERLSGLELVGGAA